MISLMVGTGDGLNVTVGGVVTAPGAVGNAIGAGLNGVAKGAPFPTVCATAPGLLGTETGYDEPIGLKAVVGGGAASTDAGGLYE